MGQLNNMDYKEYKKNLITSVINSIEKYGTNNLSSIILTGSFGRDEPTFIIDANGCLKLISDVEIALIYTSRRKLTEQLIKVVAAEFEEEINFMAISERRIRKVYNFNYSLIAPKYKTIFTYDLFSGSRTIWGRDFIGESHIDLDSCDLYEAKRLVANRIGELLYLQTISDSGNQDCLRKQWKGKLMLAIVSSFLICEGEYVSSYHGQYDAIKKDQKRADNVIGNGFFYEYNNVFKFLRECGTEYEIPDSLLCIYVKNINKMFQDRRINKPKVNSVSRSAKYFVKYVMTGMKYGLRNFEDHILQALIDGYCENKPELNVTAEIWHKVLY